MTKYHVVVGASGFLGSKIVDYLSNRDEKVLALVRKKKKLKVDNFEDLKNVKVLEYDGKKISKILKNFEIVNIYNCVVCYDRNIKTDTISKIIEANINIPTKLLEIAVEKKTNFVNFDTYYSKTEYIDEKLPHYTITKKMLRPWLIYYSDKIKIYNFIIEHLYGDPKINNKFIEKMIFDIAIKPKKKILLSSGSQKRDFIYIDDLIEILFLSLKKNIFKKGFFEIGLGNGFSISLKRFISKVKEISKSETILDFGKIPLKRNEIQNSYAFLTKTLNKKKRKTSLIENGIKKTVLSIKS